MLLDSIVFALELPSLAGVKFSFGKGSAVEVWSGGRVFILYFEMSRNACRLHELLHLRGWDEFNFPV